MELPELKEITPEQEKEVEKILSKAKKTMFFVAVKFFFGLFAANLFAVVVGDYFLKDTDQDMQTGFRFFAMIVNTIFLVRYFNKRFRDTTDIAASKIKEVLDKSE